MTVILTNQKISVWRVLALKMADPNESASYSNGKTENDDEGISMVDVLEEEQELENDANAVLGDSDDKNCTYDQGSINRQALYACATCTGTKESTGICLACSYECHEGHELFELYTKRNFRCDCGNSKFPNLTCKLSSNKESVNKQNQYNQNFLGVYCVCSRPYPDHDDETEDEMIQCVICEDWFHGRHLEPSPPQSQDFQEMICGGCGTRCSFLQYYYVDSTVVKIEKSETSEKVDVSSTESPQVNGNSNKIPHTSESFSQESCASIKSEHPITEVSSTCNDSVHKSTISSHESEDLDEQPSSSSIFINPSSSNIVKNELTSAFVKDALTEVSSSTPETIPSTVNSLLTAEVKNHLESVRCKNEKVGTDNISSQICKLAEFKNHFKEVKSRTTYWPAGWRSKLCKCNLCQELYEQRKVTFLVDESDTVHAYEERGKAKTPGPSRYDRGMIALQGMDRMQQVEVLHEYNDLKSELKDYLKKFAQNKTVVREEDIREFFNQMQSRKRQKISAVPFFCR